MSRVKTVFQITILRVFLHLLLWIMLSFLALFPPQNQPYADEITIIAWSFLPAHSSSTHRTLTHFVTPFLDSTAQFTPPPTQIRVCFVENLTCVKLYLSDHTFNQTQTHWIPC